MIKILFIGDICGKAGRSTAKKLLPGIIREHSVDFVIANGENAAGGFGLTKNTFSEIISCGINVVTNGNHVWDKKELLTLIDEEKSMLRPANLPPGNPGRGHEIYELEKSGKKIKIGVINIIGRIFMNPADCPFRSAEKAAAEIRKITPVIIVDMHAEATSEKKALAYFLDGKVSAVIGTHTHVLTADNTVFKNGTAYISDAGMTGPHDSVIGVEKDIIINRFLTFIPAHFETAKSGKRLNGVLLAIDETTGKAEKIQRLDIPDEPE